MVGGAVRAGWCGWRGAVRVVRCGVVRLQGAAGGWWCRAVAVGAGGRLAG